LPSVLLQFHATESELVAIGIRWGEKRGLAAAAETFFPTYRARTLRDALSREDRERVNRIALCRDPVDLSAPSAHEFVSRNSRCLFLSIGLHDEDGLRESAMSGKTDDSQTLAEWRALGRELKASMHVGATLRNPESGAQQDRPTHRHSAGAHELSQSGTRMLAAAGWVEYNFTDRTVVSRDMQQR
jgi:hypothetical protein